MSLSFKEEDFIRMFQLKDADFPDIARPLLNKYDLTYRSADRKDLEEYVLTLLTMLEKNEMARSREENLLAFEKGWTENLEALKIASPAAYESALRPRYYRGNKFFRYNNELVVTENPQLEYELSLIARLCLFKSYLEGVETICEIGCGSCLNLLLLSDLFPKARLIGLDWTSASGAIARELNNKLETSISGSRFDMFNPDFSVEIPEGTAFVTIHAFEQLGERFAPILAYIRHVKPSLILHYEPLLEFYDDSNLLDYLALTYCRRRGYLEGYYGHLQQIQKEGLINILGAFRPFLGGVIHESSILAWKLI